MEMKLLLYSQLCFVQTLLTLSVSHANLLHFFLLFKVSMKFNKEEVFPGTKVKLSLKASPGSVFAISAVDKSVHFLGNANDISRGQVRHSLES